MSCVYIRIQIVVGTEWAPMDDSFVLERTCRRQTLQRVREEQIARVA